MEFSKSNSENKSYQLLEKRINDDQIHINENIKEPIQEIITAIANAEVFGNDTKLNAVMFKGLPGTGKTYTALYMRTKISDILGQEIPMLSVGTFETPNDVTKLYNDARKLAQEKGRAIIFDDEVDKYGKRGESGDTSKEAILNQLLMEMQSTKDNEGVTTLCCSNRPNNIDSAFRRGKRCGKEITFDPLDKTGREHISNIEAYKKNHQFIFDKKDIDYIVSETYGAVGADIAQLITDATTYTNNKLYQSLCEIAKYILFDKNPKEKDVFEKMNELPVENLSIELKEYAKSLIFSKETFFSDLKDIDENSENYEERVSQRFARAMITKLNPNNSERKYTSNKRKSNLQTDDAKEQNELTRWIKVDKKNLEQVLSHFVPSALKDMPFEETKVKFSSLGGLDSQIAYIQRITENTIAQDKEGTTLLLCGGAGLGVTTLARAVAGEFGYNLIVLYGADQESMWVGKVKDRLLEINDRAKASKPAVVVFDNLNYLAQNAQAMDQPHKQTATSALKTILRPTKGVLYIATVENVSYLDPSIRSLFKRTIQITAPKELKDYQKVWHQHLESAYLPKENIDMEKLAFESTGLSGGQISNICKYFVELGITYSQKKLIDTINFYKSGKENESADDIEVSNIILS